MISGAALMVERLALGQAAHGHAVLVAAASDHGPAYREAVAGVELVRLASYTNPFRRQQRFVAWPGPPLRAALERFRPEVLHLHDPLGMGLPGLQAAQRLGCPVVLTLHALPSLAALYAPPLPGLRRLVEAGTWAFSRAFCARCASVVLPSAAAAAIVRAHRLQANVVANGVDVGVFSPQPGFPGEAAALRAKYGLDPKLPILLSVGRLDIEKRTHIVIRAAAAALRGAPSQLLVVGDGTRRPALEALSRRLGIADRTHFVGFVPPGEDLAGLYRLAQVFAIAAENETEGLVVVEAAVSGLPVVAVRATSLPSLVDDGRTGYLVAPRDSRAMGTRLLELLRQPALAHTMGLAGRERLAPSHSLDITLANYDRLYAELAATAGQSATGGAWPQPETEPNALWHQPLEPPRGGYG
jgi:glycosyltransferase involved in cell wall biosynthesis